MEIGIFIIPATLAVLLLELIAGAHRGIYSRNDYATLILCIAVTRAVTRPLFAVAPALLLSSCFPADRGALAAFPVLPSFLLLLFACDFSFSWVPLWANEAKGKQGATGPW